MSWPQRWQQRRLQRRTLQLLKADLAQADHWQLKPAWDPQWSCSVGSRQPLLAIHSADGSPAVVYSLGAPPSAIWRGQVLVRCGPSFDLQGRPNRFGAYQNRVVLDQVEALLVEEDPDRPLLGSSFSNGCRDRISCVLRLLGDRRLVDRRLGELLIAWGSSRKKAPLSAAAANSGLQPMIPRPCPWR